MDREVLLFNFIITSCVIIVKSDPTKSSNLHRDLRTALMVVDRASTCLAKNVIDTLRAKYSSLSPYSLFISFYTSSTGQDSVQIFFNGLDLIYDDKVDHYSLFTSQGDIRCQLCAVRLTRGPGLRDLTADLDTKHARIVIHVKPCDLQNGERLNAVPTTVQYNLATALQFLESFLYSGLAMVLPEKPVRQITITLWKSKYENFSDFQFGKLSLFDPFFANYKGGPLIHHDWLDKYQTLQCWDCLYTETLKPSSDELEFVLGAR